MRPISSTPITWTGPSLGERPGGRAGGRGDGESGPGPRLAAALAIADVLGAGRALDEALVQRTSGLAEPRDQALAREIAYGVLRSLPRLRAFVAALMRRGSKPRDLDLECLLLVGLYQLDALRVPAHAAVSQTVAAVGRLGKAWAAGFLNAVLRGFQRHQREFVAALAADPVAGHCFPEWLAQWLRRAWPGQAEGLMEASNRHPPMTLRVNLARLQRAEYARRLAAAGMTTRPLAAAPAALVLDRPLEVGALPGFAEGLVSVQDGAAQLAVGLLQTGLGQQVLDACAAPGGKTAQLLETCPGAQVTAVDLGEGRLRALRETLTRLGLNARVLGANLALPHPEPGGGEDWADRAYHRILLDAPCSATGVIRRHPDIKWLRRPTDIAPLMALQGRLLDRLWPHLHPGGILVYVTCSLLPEENHEQMLAFLQRTPDARELPLETAWGQACAVGRQVLTGEADMDGFYFARLIRAGEASAP
jgi:16S rRNA (cytosine967-C5)-methyltransferase